MRMQTGFRGFRIDKDREEELESVRAPIPPRHLVSPCSSSSASRHVSAADSVPGRASRI